MRPVSRAIPLKMGWDREVFVLEGMGFPPFESQYFSKIFETVKNSDFLYGDSHFFYNENSATPSPRFNEIALRQSTFLHTLKCRSYFVKQEIYQCMLYQSLYKQTLHP